MPSDEIEWPAPASLPSPDGEAIHVWRATFPASPEQLLSLAASLDDAERARAARFVRPRDRDRFLGWHGALRRILGRYLDVAPDQVRYVFGPQGKPSLAPEFAGSRLRFNLAHSGELALVAVRVGREVGVDVEQFRPLPDAGAIAATHFSPHERAALASLATGEQLPAFFSIWTGKEAFIKAIGQGLSYPLTRFSVPVPPEHANTQVRLEAGITAAWAVRSFAPGAGYAAAVVGEGLDWDLRRWRFE